jgi:hypothetical protein
VSIWRRIATPPRATANIERRFIGNAQKVLRTAANLPAAANTQCHCRPDKHDASSRKERHERPVGNPFAKLLKTLKVAEVLEHKGPRRLPLHPRVEAPSQKISFFLAWWMFLRENFAKIGSLTNFRRRNSETQLSAVSRSLAPTRCFQVPTTSKPGH